ncbi:MAG: PTS fructose transporter subunit IIA [Lachnospiraceae bacterium]|nr:PTS fructose transporter subunit IIA [Lachnospiraceae bacterium]MDO4407782.1 PTS fructose transporter subunit IIA [Eubacteriales bacterium]
MKYVVLVSHGEFAPGLHKAVNMLAGEEREDVLSTSLKNGMGADEFAEKVKSVLSVVGPEDEIILFADIVGGSPLATTANVLMEMDLLGRTRMIGGMNLPLVLTCVLSKDDEETAELIDELIEGAKEQIKEFVVAVDDEEEEDL